MLRRRNPKGKHGPGKVGTYAARLGDSANETGRAVDLYLGFGFDSDHAEKIRASAAHCWLADNAARFGWFPYTAPPAPLRRRRSGGSFERLSPAQGQETPLGTAGKLTP